MSQHLNRSFGGSIVRGNEQVREPLKLADWAPSVGIIDSGAYTIKAEIHTRPCEQCV